MTINSSVPPAKISIFMNAKVLKLEPYNHAVTWSEWNKVEPTPLFDTNAEDYP